MGYPSVAYFNETIIKRTLENLDSRDIRHDFTHLLNSLLCLIVVPNQMRVQGRNTNEFFFMTLGDFDDLSFLNETIVYNDEISENIFSEKADNKIFHHFFPTIASIPIKTLLDEMRNAIAHSSIRPIKDNDEWNGIILRTYRHDAQIPLWRDNYKFQIILEKDELKRLILFFARNYLEA